MSSSADDSETVCLSWNIGEFNVGENLFLEKPLHSYVSEETLDTTHGVHDSWDNRHSARNKKAISASSIISFQHFNLRTLLLKLFQMCNMPYAKSVAPDQPAHSQCLTCELDLSEESECRSHVRLREPQCPHMAGTIMLPGQ